MKILPFANSMRTEIVSSGLRIKRASVDGYNIAIRNAKVYNHNDVYKYYNMTRSISSKIIGGTTIKELPFFLGAVGMLIPLPFVSLILMGLGYLVRFASNGANALYEGQNKANTNIPI